MQPPGADVVLVRYGDASTKSAPVQRRMEDRLVENVAAILEDRDVEATVEREWTRLLVHPDSDGAETVEAAANAAADAFGVVSASPARRVPPEKDAIVEAIAETARACYHGGTFAVRARRAGDDLPFTSPEVERAGGAAASAAVDFDAEVDLEDPDVTLSAEVRRSDAFVFTEKLAGPGGLPLGSQAPLVALVSGGIDSPVAAFEVMKRGSPVVPVYLDLGDYGGPDHEARAMATVARLARYAPNFGMDVWRVPAGDVVDLLVERLGSGRMVAYRRFMFAVGAAVVERTGAEGIVTGEALGQKSSQTARNLAATSAAVDLPVHRPLLAMDKHEIEQRAREIGTYGDATIPAGCQRIAPDHPETGADRDWLRGAEPDDLFERAERVVEDAERVSPDGLDEVGRFGG